MISECRIGDLDHLMRVAGSIGVISEIAYAKINLALHIRRRREDGYHELETLFAFLDNGDRLLIAPAERFCLDEYGMFAGQSGTPEANLITRAAALVGQGSLRLIKVTLDKRLPVSAGLGGGSADAAATLRLLDAHDRFDLAVKLGADVPACMASVPVIGSGTGTALSSVNNDVNGLACLLINPMVPLPTGPVFAQWDGIDRGAMPTGSASEIMLKGRNDLEDAAISLCPVIRDVLATLGKTQPLLARMSGSGATCFALYDDFSVAAAHEARIRSDRSDRWWTMIGRLR